jgi:hypothetical protein
MRFFFPRKAYYETHVQKKFFKNPKIVCAQVTLTKTGLSAVQTFSPLGVKMV